MSRRVVACIVVAAALSGACSDDEPSAQERTCEARSDLRSSMDEVRGDLSDANLGAARDGLDDVQEDLTELTDALRDLGEEQAQEVSPLIDDLRAIVERLRGADDLATVGEGLADASDTLNAVLDQLGAAVSC